MTEPLGLIADIGGTNVRFALCDRERFYDPVDLKVGDYPTLVDAVRDALTILQPPRPVCEASFAIAAPVKQDDVIQMTNHHWKISVREMAEELGFPVHFMNDFKAVALCVPHLEAGKDYKPCLTKGESEPKPVANGNIAILGPGTGLGVASMIWVDALGRYEPVPGEGGHTTAPSRTHEEFEVVELIQSQKANYHHISAERVCSGNGLVNIYNALRELRKREDLPELRPEEISAKALDGSCEISRKSLNMMLAFLGRRAADHALTISAFGGVFIAGGIPAKLGDYVNEPFRSEFLNKGRYRGFLSDIPSYVITNPYMALIGLKADLMQRWDQRAVQAKPGLEPVALAR